MALFHKAFAPITFRIGFLNSPMPNVRESFMQWKRTNFGSIKCVEVHEGIEQAFVELQPMTPIPRRWLLVPTRSNWVAYFDNCMRGPDPAPAVCYLSQQLACRGVVVTSIPHTLSEEVGKKPGTYGAIQFELFASNTTGFLNCERSVSVAFEGGRWSFDAVGAVQSFENVAAYRSKLILDRFNHEMLTNYCYALGIRVDSPDFYQAPAVLITADDPVPPGHPILSLARLQAEMNLMHTT